GECGKQAQNNVRGVDDGLSAHPAGPSLGSLDVKTLHHAGNHPGPMSRRYPSRGSSDVVLARFLLSHREPVTVLQEGTAPRYALVKGESDGWGRSRCESERRLGRAAAPGGRYETRDEPDSSPLLERA